MPESRPDPEVPAKARRRRHSAEYKLQILEDADRATEPDQVGALLRREGLYSSHLAACREQRAEGTLTALARPREAASGSTKSNYSDARKSCG